MSEDVLSLLKSVSTLSKQSRGYKYIPTGSYALDYVISGKMDGGVPIPGITQFIGDSSTGKSAFATAVLGNAQRQGYYTLYEDAENTLSSEFARILGLNPDVMAYNNPGTIEDAFEHMEAVVKEIRQHDKETPIVIVLDSLPVLDVREEAAKDDYGGNNMAGALRAKRVGDALRKFDKIVKPNNVCLIIINQLRSKVGVLYGNPETFGAGGRSLEYYLTVNLRTKRTEKLQENGQVVGIAGNVINEKNKCALPYKRCEFKLLFDKGFDPYCDILPLLETAGHLTKNGGWYTITESGEKFQSKEFYAEFKTAEKFKSIRAILGIKEAE